MCQFSCGEIFGWSMSLIKHICSIGIGVCSSNINEQINKFLMLPCSWELLLLFYSLYKSSSIIWWTALPQIILISTVFYLWCCLTFDTGMHWRRDVGMQILNKDHHLTHYLQKLAI